MFVQPEHWQQVSGITSTLGHMETLEILLSINHYRTFLFFQCLGSYEIFLYSWLSLNKCGSLDYAYLARS